MDINQMLQQTGAVDAISRELNVDPATAQAGAAALLPSILSGFQNPAAASDAGSGASALGDLGGLGGLLGTIGGLGGGSLLDNVTSEAPTEIGKGNQILGQIFGSKDGSRAVAASAAAQSGVEPSLLKKMLPILAMAAAGYVMKNAGQSGGLGGLFGGGAAANADPAQPEPAGSGDILGQLMGAAGKFLGR
ncbi:MAG TPA: DUF937 domain-containing protein [Allosphingosinicella sp.]|nr:DUF937 domain-containing protein [Allosphingosinicella sp.]